MTDEDFNAEEEQGSAPDDVVDFYAKMVRGIGGLPEIAMRRARLDQSLRSLEPEIAVWSLDQLVRGALWGRTPEIDAMLACTSWLIRLREDKTAYTFLQELYQYAHDSNRMAVLFMLRDAPPHRALPPNARLPEVRLPINREVTLGERRQMAAGGNRQILERLIHENSPLIIEKILGNPQIRLSDVLTIASRRPTLPELLREVVMHESWFKEHQIREALVYNPYLPTGMAVRVLPTLHIDVLRKIRFAGDLHPMVQEAAGLFVDLREHRTAPWGH